jgi:hypothetical protein
LDLNIKSKTSLKADQNRISLEDQKAQKNENTTIKKLIGSQKYKISQVNLCEPD